MRSIRSDFAPQSFDDGLLRFEVGPEHETCLVRIVGGDLDLCSVTLLENELHRLLSSDVESVVLDLTELQFIDSTGLQCLVRAAERSRRNGDRLRVIAPAGGHVDGILRLTGVREVLPLIP